MAHCQRTNLNQSMTHSGDDDDGGGDDGGVSGDDADGGGDDGGIGVGSCVQEHFPWEFFDA